LEVPDERKGACLKQLGISREEAMGKWGEKLVKKKLPVKRSEENQGILEERGRGQKGI